MRKTAISVFIVAVAAVALYFALGGSLPSPMSSRAPAESATPGETPVKPSTHLVSDAHLVPARIAQLTLPTGGMVALVSAQEGEHVGSGQLLLQLDAARQRIAIAQAEANVRRASARLSEAKATPVASEVAAAEAAVVAAEAALQQVLDGADPEQLIAARAEVARAVAAQKQAQAAYDLLGESEDLDSRPESLQLEQANAALEAARARLALLEDQPAEATVAAARAELRRAEAQLDLLRRGTGAEMIAALESEVQLSQLDLERAQMGLADLELRAPFAGTVVSVNASAGEYVAPGAPLVMLADLSSLLVETEDLTELDVVRISEGAPVTVTFDAIADLALRGHVQRIKPLGQSRQGDVTYTVVIALERQDARLRWNMTAIVAFEGL